MTNINRPDIRAFFALVRGGLWEQEVQLSPYGNINFDEISRLAHEQTVIGLIAAGIEHTIDIKIPKEFSINIAAIILQIENFNLAINKFTEDLFILLANNNIQALLIKGQGIAQCYDRSLWRSSGDVDLLLNNYDYEKAKRLLIPIADTVEAEVERRKHLELHIHDYDLELHGTLRGNYLCRIDKKLDFIHNTIFTEKKFHIWQNGSVPIFLPCPDDNVILLFTHIHQHFTQDGIGVRQIADWCRLLWKYYPDLDIQKLSHRLHEMRLMTEWKVFASFAVNYLGMPKDFIPFYSPRKKWARKANRLAVIIITKGNMGRNIDSNYKNKYPTIIAKIISLWRITVDAAHQFNIFPLDSLKVWWSNVRCGIFYSIRDDQQNRNCPME